jgi:hypothetical protein
MKELEASGSALEADVTKENLRDIIGDMSETTAAAIGEGIPGLSILIKAAKAYQSIKDQFLMDKVLTFLYEISKMTADSRKNLVAKINTDKIYGQKFGAFVLIALDRHDFADKSVYLARACRFLEQDAISINSFVRIKTMIENLNLVDIKRWIDNEYRSFPKSEDLAYNYFLANGVIKTQHNFNKILSKNASRSFNLNRDVVRISLTSLGSILYYIVQDKHLDQDTIDRLRLFSDR